MTSVAWHPIATKAHHQIPRGTAGIFIGHPCDVQGCGAIRKSLIRQRSDRPVHDRTHRLPKTSKRWVGIGMNRNVWLISSVGAGLSIFGCECDGDRPPLTRLSAQISVYDPGIEGKPAITEVDVGAVALGVPFLRAVGVKNIGDDTLRICMAGATDPACTESSRIQPENA